MSSQHGALESVLFHLVPGIAVLLGSVFVFGPLAVALSLPRHFGNALNVLVVLLPLELGCLLHLGRRRNGRLSLEGIVLNREKVPPGQLALIVAALFIWALIVIRLLSGIDEMLLERVFYWVPTSLLPESDLSAYPANVLVATHMASVAVIGLAAPIVEELYFRGFLLPRVSWMGVWAPVWNTVLFNAYHFWSPWRIVTRTIFTLPMVYVVWRKRSISIGIWWHCLGNVLGELVALATVWKVAAHFGNR